MDERPVPVRPHVRRFPRGIIGRIDDMLVVRGENIYPSAIEDVLHAFPELGTEFEIIVTRPKALDELTVRAELARTVRRNDTARTRRRAAQAQARHSRRNRFTPAGTLTRTDLKSRRVRDERPKS